MLINFSSTCCDFPLNLVKDCTVTWLLQSGIEKYLLTHFRHLKTLSKNSAFQIAHQHPYDDVHLVTATTSDSVSLLNVSAL